MGFGVWGSRCLGGLGFCSFQALGLKVLGFGVLGSRCLGGRGFQGFGDSGFNLRPSVIRFRVLGSRCLGGLGFCSFQALRLEFWGHCGAWSCGV